jgi:hypothetical protein
VRDGLRRSFERGEAGGGPAPDGYQVLRELDERGRLRRTDRPTVRSARPTIVPAIPFASAVAVTSGVKSTLIGS